MGIECRACLSSCFELTKQAIVVTILTLDKIRKNPEALQKICILIESLIQAINFYKNTHYLPRLIQVLDIAYSFDFYGFCRVPKYLFHIYRAERFDEYLILDQLETVLCHNWKIKNEEGLNRDQAVHAFAKQQLIELLEEMEEFNYDLKTEEEVKTLLQNRLKRSLKDIPKKDFSPDAIDLKDLKIPLKENPFLEALCDAIFIGVDIACVPSFLQDWGLIDLSFISDGLGKIISLQRLPVKNLDEAIRGVMCFGFLVQVIKALQSLYLGGMSQAESRNAKLITAAGSAEFLYNLTILQKRDLRLIVFLAIIAKSLGLVQIVLEPESSYFDN